METPPKLTDEENKCVQARISDVSVEQLTSEDLTDEVYSLIISICAITGANLPLNDDFTDALVRELKVFLLNMGYAKLSLDEVSLAFRLNAKGVKYPSGLEIERVKFSGAFLNIDFIGKVLEKYMEIRNQVDRKFQIHIDGN